MALSAAQRAPSWDVPRSTVASRHLLDTGEAHGIDAARCLAGTGLTTAHLAEPAAEVQASQELAIVRNLLAQVGDAAGLGIETGLRYTLASTGILGYALLTSPTVRDAVTIARRYATLTSTFLTIAAHETDTGVVLEFDVSETPADVRQFLVQRDLAAIAHVVPLLIGADHPGAPVLVELQATDFPHDFLAGAGLHFTVKHDAPRTAITIPAELLDQPMPAADPDTAAMCIRQCEQLLDRRAERGGLSAQIRARLIQDPSQMPPMATVAREYAVAERTLHRRLAAENTSYRALVDEIRETLAVELLGNNLTVEEVARHLGYSETAAFTHAFTRWRGHPPSHQHRTPAGQPVARL
jgi:AraC-like DNA-binding protein